MCSKKELYNKLILVPLLSVPTPAEASHPEKSDVSPDFKGQGRDADLTLEHKSGANRLVLEP